MGYLFGGYSVAVVNYIESNIATDFLEFDAHVLILTAILNSIGYEICHNLLKLIVIAIYIRSLTFVE